MPTDLEIVTPERLVLSRPVDMVVIPAADGEMGVLPGHAPMIVLLRGGGVRLYDGAQVTERFFVMGGFAEVTPERCTVLATEVTPVAELSADDAERRIAEASATYEATDKNDIPALDTALDTLLAATAMRDAARAG